MIYVSYLNALQICLYRNQDIQTNYVVAMFPCRGLNVARF